MFGMRIILFLLCFAMLSTRQININGFVTLGHPFISFSPSLFPLAISNGTVIIAPFFADIDLRPAFDTVAPGRLFYQCYSRSYIGQPLSDSQQGVFDRALQAVQSYYGDYSFEPTMICVITWSNVQPYPSFLNTLEVCQSGYLIESGCFDAMNDNVYL